MKIHELPGARPQVKIFLLYEMQSLADPIKNKVSFIRNRSDVEMSVLAPPFGRV